MMMNPNRTIETTNTVSEQLDFVEELVWKLVDDVASEQEVHRLEQLLRGDAECRTRYLECLNLHSGLTEFFRDSTEVKSSKPAAGLLATIMSGLPSADFNGVRR